MEKYEPNEEQSVGFCRITCMNCNWQMVSTGWPLKKRGDLSKGVKDYEVYQCGSCHKVIRVRYIKEGRHAMKLLGYDRTKCFTARNTWGKK